MLIRYLYNTKGDYVAFVRGANVFAIDGTWLGFVVSGNELYDTKGNYQGIILDDDRVAVNPSDRFRAQRIPPIRPLRPIVPLRPLRRLRSLPLPYPWKDLFEDGPQTSLVPVDVMTSMHIGRVMNHMIYAYDQTPLGRISQSKTDPDSLANPYSPYGNKYIASSILNPYGPYGSEYSRLSPFNRFTTTPPFVRVSESEYYWISRNSAIVPRIDPLALLNHLGVSQV